MTLSSIFTFRFLVRRCLPLGLLAIVTILFSDDLRTLSLSGKTPLVLSPNDTDIVRRVALDVTVNAPGIIESSNNTRVECEIERLELRVQGRRITSNGSTTILSLVPDGSLVKAGDILCTLDSSDFEEMVRLQRINVERAISEQRQAEMSLEVAKISLEEYRNGTAKQQIQGMRGQIALAETDASRVSGRLDWARKMYKKGYLSQSSIRAEELTLQRTDLKLSQAQIALNTFERFSQPKVEHTLNVRIVSLGRVLTSETESVKRFKDRLKNYERMVANCTIRAPHDGMLVHANNNDRGVRIEEGSEVRQGQTLFYLPDLSKMQVMSRLSESVVKKVSAGMPVRVNIESLSAKSYTGIVDRISQFPIMPSNSRMAQDVKNYFCVIKIIDADGALRPGLNAEIDILTDQIGEALVISPEVVTVQDNSEFCFVRLSNGMFEKRQIRTSNGDPGALKVVQGLNEGEVVLRTLRLIDDHADMVERVALLDPASSPQSPQEWVAEGSDNDVNQSIVLGEPSKDSDLVNPDMALPAVSKGY